MKYLRGTSHIWCKFLRIVPANFAPRHTDSRALALDSFSSWPLVAILKMLMDMLTHTYNPGLLVRRRRGRKRSLLLLPSWTQLNVNKVGQTLGNLNVCQDAVVLPLHKFLRVKKIVHVI